MNAEPGANSEKVMPSRYMRYKLNRFDFGLFFGGARQIEPW
jgi:hypothetical protein